MNVLEIIGLVWLVEHLLIALIWGYIVYTVNHDPEVWE